MSRRATCSRGSRISPRVDRPLRVIRVLALFILGPGLADAAEVGRELARRLDARIPDLSVRLFGGALTVSAAKLARWYLLWAIALNGHGRVPPALLYAA